MSESDFLKYYRSLPDSELLQIASDWQGLVEDARPALKSEFSRRGLELQEGPEEEDPSPDYRNLTTIRQYRDLSEAIVARAAIESAGIYCFLKDENLVRLDWQMSNLVGGIRLQVSAADVQAAEAVLLEPAPQVIDLPGQPNYEQPHCPRCDSIEIAWERRGRKAALFSLYLFSLPFPRGKESWRCNNCGLRWVDEDDSVQAANE
jgi:hypothetical protein